jgi:hypothetical protein
MIKFIIGIIIIGVSVAVIGTMLGWGPLITAPISFILGGIWRSTMFREINNK